MSITSDNSKRSIMAIFNPTIEEINNFFNQDVTERLKGYMHERILVASIAENKSINQKHYSLSLTTNNSELRQNTQYIEWVVEE